MARSSVSVALHLDPASDPISGSVVYPDGRKLAFAGWIELTAALEGARHAGPLDVVAHGKQSAAPGSDDEPSEDMPERPRDEQR
jgi:hypothetical protein